MAERPNILLVVLDTARADAFEPYGAPAGASPAIAQLAGRGAALTARSNACWTLPSHASLFTGLLPRASGLIRMPGDSLMSCRGPLQENGARYLPSVLSGYGYETKGASANLWVSHATGFSQGFDQWSEIDTGRQSGIHSSSPKARARWLAEGARARVDDGAAEAEQRLTGWIGERQRAEAPFFWFVNLIECHSPYLPPHPYNPLSIGDRVRSAAEARRYLNLGAIWKACAGGFDVPDEALERMKALYAASIRLMDDWLARLLERLDAANELEDTIVIVTSDHGENLGESGLMGHSFSLDDRLTRVPMVWAGPTAAPGAEIALADIPALLAAAAGIEDHPWSVHEGPIVAEFDPPTGRDDPRVSAALADWGLGEEAIPLITSHLTSASLGDAKLIAGEHTESDGSRVATEVLHDLAADPLEQSPLSGDAARAHPRYAELRAAIDRASAGREEPAVTTPQAEAGGISDEERRKLEEKMRLLGYM